MSAPQSPWLSRVLATSCLLAAIALPLVSAGMLWLMPPKALALSLGVTPDASELRAWQQELVWLVGLLPVACAGCGLWHAARCFRGFARGEYFTEANARALRGLSAGMMASGFLGLLVLPISTLVFTWYRPTGQHQISVSFDSQSLLLLLFAASVWQIASVLRRAIALAQENEAFV